MAGHTSRVSTPKPGPEWLIQTSDGETRWTSKKLRKRILEREVSGEELVRRLDEPDDGLRPLHTLPLYQQLLGLSPEAAALETAARRTRGLLAHGAAFVAVGALTGFPWWLIFWGLGLFSHLTRTLPSVRRLQDSGRAWRALVGDHSAASVSAPAESEPSAEPAGESVLPDAAAADWDALRPLLASLPEPTQAALTGAHEQLVALHGRAAELDALLAEESPESLDAQAAELEVDLASAPDDRTRELVEQSARALEARREAVEELRAAQLRVRAQSRAIGHQLRSARLALAGRGLDAEPAKLQEVLDGLAEQSRSTDELEETLAAARRARAAQRS